MLTGVDNSLNIAAVSKATNDAMSAVEREIVNRASNPHWLEIEIPSYHDEKGRDSRVPKRFVYRLYETHKEPEDDDPATFTETVEQHWLQVGKHGFDQKYVSRAIGMKSEMQQLGWKIEDLTQVGSRNKSLAFLVKHLPPVEKRPLAFLDYWFLMHTPPEFSRAEIDNYIDGIAVGCGFSGWARSAAIRGNILINDNWLLSDAHGKKDAVEVGGSVVMECHKSLIEGGGLNAPHVDHVVPQSCKGPNCFSNAQITSMQYNVQKGNNTKQFEFADSTWISQMQAKIQRMDVG